MQTMIQKVALAVFKDKKVMMVRTAKNPEIFYSVGGKIEPGENDIQCLKREVHEEIQCDIDNNSIEFLQEFTAPAHGKENTLLNIKLYKGTLIGEPKPSHEVVEIRYFDSTTDKKHLTITGEQIFQWLKKNDYIA